MQGRVAAELLLALLDAGSIQTRSMPVSELVVRSSTAAA
jgi:hypothetical protein